MKYFDCRGYILKSNSLGEVDKIFTIFTIEYGKLRVVARGVKKPSSKLSGLLQPFNLLQFQLTKGKNLDIIIGTQSLISNVQLYNSQEKLEAAYYFTELCSNLLADEQVNKSAFNLYKQSIEQLQTEKNYLLLIQYFGLRFLKTIGSQPNLSNAKPNSKNYLIYDSANTSSTRPNQHYGIISENTIKLWRLILENEYSQLNKIQNIQNSLNEGQQLLNNYYKYHFDFVSKSLHIFD